MAFHLRFGQLRGLDEQSIRWRHKTIGRNANDGDSGQRDETQRLFGTGFEHAVFIADPDQASQPMVFLQLGDGHQYGQFFGALSGRAIRRPRGGTNNGNPGFGRLKARCA